MSEEPRIPVCYGPACGPDLEAVVLFGALFVVLVLALLFAVALWKQSRHG